MLDLQPLIKKVKASSTPDQKLLLINQQIQEVKDTLDSQDLLHFIKTILPLLEHWYWEGPLTVLIHDTSKQIKLQDLVRNVFPAAMFSLNNKHLEDNVKITMLALWVGNPANSEEADQLMMSMLQPSQSTDTPLNKDIDKLCKLCVKNEDKLSVLSSWLGNKKNKIDFNVLQNILSGIPTLEFFHAIDNLRSILDAKDFNELIQKRFLNAENKWTDIPDNTLNTQALAKLGLLTKNEMSHIHLKLNILIEGIRSKSNIDLYFLSELNTLTDKEMISMNDYIDHYTNCYLEKINGFLDQTEMTIYESFGDTAIHGILILAWIRTMIDSLDTHKDLSGEQALLLKNYSEFKRRFLVVNDLVDDGIHRRNFDKMLEDHILQIGIFTEIFGPDTFVILEKYLVTSALALEELLNTINIIPVNQMARVHLHDFFVKNRTEIIDKNKYDVFLSLSQLLSLGLGLIENDADAQSLQKEMFDILESWLGNKKNKVDFNVLQNILSGIPTREFLHAIDSLRSTLDAKDLNELIQKRFLNAENKWTDIPDNTLNTQELAKLGLLTKNEMSHIHLKLNILVEGIRSQSNTDLYFLSELNTLTDNEMMSMNDYIDHYTNHYLKKFNYILNQTEMTIYESYGNAAIQGILILAWIRTMIESPDTHKNLSAEQTLLLKNYSEFKRRFLVVNNLVENKERHGRDFDKMLDDHILQISIFTEIFGPDTFVILGKYLVTSALALERLLNNLSIIPVDQMARVHLHDFFVKNRTEIIDKNKYDVFLSLSQLLSEGLGLIENDANAQSLQTEIFDILEKCSGVQQCHDEIAKYVIQYFLKAMNAECDPDLLLKHISPKLFGQFTKARSAMQGKFYQGIFDQFMIADITGKPLQDNTESKELAQLFKHNQNIRDELSDSGIDIDKAFHYQKKTQFEYGGKIDNIDVNDLIQSLWNDLEALYLYADENKLENLKKLIDNFQQTMLQGYKRTPKTSLSPTITKKIFNKLRKASLTAEESRLGILIGAIRKLNLPHDRSAELLNNIGNVEEVLNPLLLKHSPQSLMEVMWNNIEQLYKKADSLKTTPPNKALEEFLERLKKLSDTFLESIESDLLKTFKDTNNLSKVSKHLTPALFDKIYEDLSKKLQSNPSLIKSFIREMKESNIDNKEINNLIKSLEGNSEQLNTLVADTSAQKYTRTAEKNLHKKRFTIQVWDKSSPETFNLGAEVGCCLAPDGLEFPAMVERRMDDAMFMHVVIDAETNKPVSLAWLFFARDSNNDIYVVANFFEIAASYVFNTDMRDTIVSELQEYIGTYAKEVGAKGFLMRPLTYGNIPDFKNCEQYDTQLQKVGGYLPLNGITSSYYLDALQASSFHVFKSQKPEYTPGF